MLALTAGAPWAQGVCLQHGHPSSWRSFSLDLVGVEDEPAEADGRLESLDLDLVQMSETEARRRRGMSRCQTDGRLRTQGDVQMSADVTLYLAALDLVGIATAQGYLDELDG